MISQQLPGANLTAHQPNVAGVSTLPGVQVTALVEQVMVGTVRGLQTAAAMNKRQQGPQQVDRVRQ